MLDLTTFDFDEQAVRVVTRDGEPWFVAADVCRVLGIANSRDAVSRLEDDERQMVNLNTVGNSDGIRGNPNATIVSESGLYALIFTSTKPEARRFRKWVTSEVLPSLRRTGRYEMPPRDSGKPADLARQDVTNWLSLIREARLLRGPGAAIQLWDRSPLPPLESGLSGTAQSPGAVEAFLAAGCTVTGRLSDRISVARFVATLKEWSEDHGVEPLPDRSVHLRMAALAGRWEHPETGQRFSRVKSAGIITYCGLIIREAP